MLTIKVRRKIMKLKPLFDRVLLKTQKEEKQKTGILLPSSLEEKPMVAEVIAMGDGETVDGKVPMNVKIGDKVLFTKYAAQEFKFNNEEYLIIRQEDILAIIE